MVFPLKAIKICTADLKSGYAPGCILDPDAAQGSAIAQEKGSDIDIRGLVVLNGDHLLKYQYTHAWFITTHTTCFKQTYRAILSTGNVHIKLVLLQKKTAMPKI